MVSLWHFFISFSNWSDLFRAMADSRPPRYSIWIGRKHSPINGAEEIQQLLKDQGFKNYETHTRNWENGGYIVSCLILCKHFYFKFPSHVSCFSFSNPEVFHFSWNLRSSKYSRICNWRGLCGVSYRGSNFLWVPTLGPQLSPEAQLSWHQSQRSQASVWRLSLLHLHGLLHRLVHLHGLLHRQGGLHFLSSFFLGFKGQLLLFNFHFISTCFLLLTWQDLWSPWWASCWERAKTTQPPPEDAVWGSCKKRRKEEEKRSRSWKAEAAWCRAGPEGSGQTARRWKKRGWQTDED